jgi:hypothetical protein
MLQTNFLGFEYIGRRKIKWLLNAEIVKINREYLCIAFNKKWENKYLFINSNNKCVSYAVPV